MMAKGDHIRVRRTGYWHHGIDCGDGTVIHFSGPRSEKQNAVVRRTSLDEFAKGSEVFTVPHGLTHCPEAIVARAEARLGETGYNVLRNNCEHFARWCATGRGISRQVNRAIGAATVATCAMVGMVPVGLAAGTIYAARRLTRRSR